MPVLPPSLYSNFYTVNINGSTFIARTFDIKVDNSATKKTYIQGSGAHLVQNVNPTYYTYTIEAPMLINYYNFNSLWGIAQDFANNQIAALNNSGSFANDIFLEEFSIVITESDVIQRMVLKSSFGYPSNAYPITGTLGVIPLSPMRVVKNYDLFINLNGMLQNVYLEGSEFSIKFENTPKTFINLNNEIVFLVKNYDLMQKFNIVGTESSQYAADFAAGTFLYQGYNIIMYVGNPNINPSFLNYTPPFIIKTRSDLLSADQLVKTELDLSLYGSTSPILFY